MAIQFYDLGHLIIRFFSFSVVFSLTSTLFISSVLPRLDQLLPLNALVFKEESGYRGFYHHLLKPYEHYVPL